MQLAGIYALLALAWIVLSDLAQVFWAGHEWSHFWFSVAKGGFFVAVTSLLLFWLATVMVRRLQKAELARDHAEEEGAAGMARASRLYLTLARANEAALSATERAGLCRRICEALVECAGMRLAWIGWVNPGTQRIDVESCIGPGAAYTDGLVISVDPAVPESRGPTGRSIIEQRGIACQAIATSAPMRPWRERALQHGLRSSASVPVRDAEGRLGAMTIYSGEEHFFTPEIMDLLAKLAADLSHGLEVMAVRRTLERQTAALRTSEHRWQFALEGSGNGVWDWDLETGEMFYSSRIMTMLDHVPGEIPGRQEEWEKRIHPDDAARTKEQLRACLSGDVAGFCCEHRLRCKDGSYRWMLNRGQIVERAAGGTPRRMIGTLSDLTERKQAEEALRTSAAITRATFEQAAVGIAHVSPDGCYLRVNRRLCEIVGYAEQEFLRLNFQDITHPDDLHTDRRMIAQMLRGDIQTYTLDKRYVRKDGSVVPVSLTVSLCRDERDAPAYFIAVVQDVSEREVAERERCELLDRLTLIADHIPGFIYQYRLRPDGSSHFPYASLGIREIYGVTPEEVEEDATLVFRALHPEDRDRVAVSIMQSANTLEPWRDTYRVVLPDGRTIWVRGQSTPQKRPDGSILWHGYIYDITSRHHTEERMQLLDTALQAMPAGIVITDKDGRIEWVNRGFSQMTGYDIGEASGQNPRLLKSGRQGDVFYEALWQTILRGEVWNGELVNRRKDGTEYHERMIIAPVSHAQEGITHFIAIKQDITEQKQLEQQLLRSQRIEGIGLLAGGIAHDLNNVLAPILLSAELLRLRTREPLDLRSLEVIESSARRGTGIVRQVLTFARGIDGQRIPLRIRDIVRELVLILEETFPRDIEIRRDIATDTPMVLGDTTQLHQVLLNLAVNARDAMPNGGRLAFRASPVVFAEKRMTYASDLPPGAYVQFSVEDTGEGMSAVVRDHIFEPFYTTKPRGKGTGLGLPTVLGIIRSHGGGIEVDSTPGQGSVFRIYLPALPAEHEEGASATEAPVVEGRGRLVLVCDDEPPIREVAALLLRQVGFEVIEAGNGREALQQFAAKRDLIDGVLMDIMMPLLTGDRAAAEMLTQRPDLPVLFMSGLMEPDTVQAALKNVGRTKITLLRKPFAAPELQGALAELLAGNSAASAASVRGAELPERPPPG